MDDGIVRELRAVLGDRRLGGPALETLFDRDDLDHATLVAIEKAIPAGDQALRARYLRRRVRHEPALIVDYLKALAADDREGARRLVLPPVTAAIRPHLAKALAHDDPRVRMRAAEMLGDHAAHETTPPDDVAATTESLVSRIGDESVEVRRTITWRLVALPSTAATTAALRRLTADADGDVRRTAILGLGQATSAKGEVIGLLEKLARKSGDDGVGAKVALAHLVPESPRTLDLLADGLWSADDHVRRAATERLREQTTDPAPIVAKAIAALERDGSTVEERRRALACITTIGPRAAAAMPVVRRALDARAFHVLRGAIRAVGAIGPAAKDAVPRLVELLGTGMAEAAIDALGGVGPPAAKVAGPPLFDRLASPYQNHQRAAGRALSRLGDGVVDELVSCFRREPMGAERQGARHWAIEGFRDRGEGGLTTLEAALEHDDPAIRGGAVRALTVLGLPPERVEPYVSVASADPHWFVRAMAMTSWPFASDEVEVLEAGASDPDHFVRRQARLALEGVRKRKKR